MGYFSSCSDLKTQIRHCRMSCTRPCWGALRVVISASGLRCLKRSCSQVSNGPVLPSFKRTRTACIIQILSGSYVGVFLVRRHPTRRQHIKRFRTHLSRASTSSMWPPSMPQAKQKRCASFLPLLYSICPDGNFVSRHLTGLDAAVVGKVYQGSSQRRDFCSYQGWKVCAW